MMEPVARHDGVFIEAETPRIGHRPGLLIGDAQRAIGERVDIIAESRGGIGRIDVIATIGTPLDPGNEFWRLEILAAESEITSSVS